MNIGQDPKTKEVPTSLSSGRILNPAISKPRGRMETGWLRSKPIATYHPHFNSRWRISKMLGTGFKPRLILFWQPQIIVLTSYHLHLLLLGTNILPFFRLSVKCLVYTSLMHPHLQLGNDFCSPFSHHSPPPCGFLGLPASRFVGHLPPPGTPLLPSLPRVRHAGPARRATGQRRSPRDEDIGVKHPKWEYLDHHWTSKICIHTLYT